MRARIFEVILNFDFWMKVIYEAVPSIPLSKVNDRVLNS
jgi:hypothetical protein